MLTYNGTTAPSHRELMKLYQNIFDTRVAAGEILPPILPHDGYGLLAVLIYLWIPHVNRPWLYTARWPLLVFITAFNLNLIRGTQTVYGGTGFGGGLVAAWCVVWSFTWIVWNAPQFDAKRVQRKEEQRSSIPASPQAMMVNPEASGNIIITSNGNSNRKATKDSGLKQRNAQNGHSELKIQDKSRKGVNTVMKTEVKGPPQPEYYWQSYPYNSPQDRISWVLDLIFNFRGPGWNWEVPSNPSLPAQVKVGLGEPVDIESMQLKSSIGVHRFTSRAELFSVQIPRLVIGYLMLDALKVILMKDPYFLLGPNDYPLPPHLSQVSPSTLIIIRQSLSLLAIVTSLETIFVLSPLFFCIILGPEVLNARGEFWQYPTTWGSFENITKKGLQGLWGGWWHQTFRFAFAAPTNFLIRHGILRAGSHATKLVGTIVAFAISGFLHASGSYTQVPNTKPLYPFVFFMLQAVGIIIQSSFCAYFKTWIQKMPLSTRTAGNFAFTFTWLYCTGQLLIDDFARGGIWLFQPVPISPLRAMGYGEPGDSWWCWEGIKISWYSGKNWWQRGIAL